MNCKDIGFGTYDCAYNIMLPYYVTDPTDKTHKKQTKMVSIDKCLLPEILLLWEAGIKTTGCCCGHGDHSMAFIGVKDECIQKMKDLGYEVYFNECRPGAEDSFVPKTPLHYINADMGFNWWEERNDVPMTQIDSEYEVCGLTLRQKMALEWIIFKARVERWLDVLKEGITQ